MMKNYAIRLQNKKALKFALSWRFFHLIEEIVMALLQWVPSLIGSPLRGLVYKIFFGKLGNRVEIQTGVEFFCAYRMEIGDKVSISRDVRIRSIGPYDPIKIGNGVSFDRGVDIKAHGNQAGIEIGDRTYLGPYTCLSGGKLKIGKDCLIASHSSIYSNNHIFSNIAQNINQQGNSYKGITIEDNCWLGTGVKVLDGVTIGEGSVIGAGAVITKNIPPYSIAVGVPAKVISSRQPSEEIALS
jgi:acetyltransferase-like isoleucine patch superfamily enzyme